ncbi:hypothetical protein [Planomonospora alba]|uniref:hypothetical protein n=1 Tax=Planomonospora alba TaxID=161354 RepID=UPI0031E92531
MSRERTGMPYLRHARALLRRSASGLAVLWAAATAAYAALLAAPGDTVCSHWPSRSRPRAGRGGRAVRPPPPSWWRSRCPRS